MRIKQTSSFKNYPNFTKDELYGINGIRMEASMESLEGRLKGKSMEYGWKPRWMKLRA